MRLLPQSDGNLRLRFDHDEAALLGTLTAQLVELLESHSGSQLDPDPLFASLEVGGTEETPDDPALARLFPDAYDENDDSAQFRRVTEQGLLNRKLQDALVLIDELPDGHPAVTSDEVDTFVAAQAASTGSKLPEVTISPETLPAWVRTLTALRLAIAARIGLDDESDYERLAADPEARSTVYVYDWLAAVLDSVLRMMFSLDDDDDS